MRLTSDIAGTMYRGLDAGILLSQVIAVMASPIEAFVLGDRVSSDKTICNWHKAIWDWLYTQGRGVENDIRVRCAGLLEITPAKSPESKNELLRHPA